MPSDLVKAAAKDLGLRGWRQRIRRLKEDHGEDWREELNRLQSEYGKLRGLSDEERLVKLKAIRGLAKGEGGDN
jgi:hypothetical protein